MKSMSMKMMIITLLAVILFSFVAPTVAHADGFWDNFNVEVDGDSVTTGATTTNQGFPALIESLKNFIVGIAGVATVIAVGFFIFNFMKLGGSNSRTRSEAISGLIYSGIATAGLGSVTLITAMFYGMIGK